MTTLLVPAALAAALLFHLGYAWTRLALPAAWSAQRLLLAPLVGFALFTIITATLTNLSALTPQQIAAGLALLALPLNLWAWWKGRGAAAQRPRLAPRLVLAALMLLVFLGALSPALRNGPAPIGENWDVGEFYLPLGRALQMVSQRDLAQLPDNPVLRILTTPPVNARIHAFSYLHATASAGSGIDPLRSFPALMALFLALSVPAVALLGHTLGLRPWLCCAAAALVGLNWLLLWATYNGFAMHATAFALLPAALAATLLALKIDPGQDTDAAADRHAPSDDTPFALATAALLVAGLALSYQPALTAYVVWVAALLLLGLWRAVRAAAGTRRAALVALLGRTALLGMLAFLLSGIGQYFLFFRNGFLAQYLERDGGMTIRDFVPLPAALGLDPAWQGLASLAPPLATFALPAAVALAVLALFQRPNAPLLVLLAGAVAYQGLMFALRYPYGFYKGVSFAVPLLALFLVSAFQHPHRRSPFGGRLASTTAGGVGLLVLAATAASWLGTQQGYLNGARRVFDEQRLALGELRQALPAGADVLVPPLVDQPRIVGGLLGYELLGHPVWGGFSSAYSSMDRPLPPGRTVPFALLSAAADPAQFGYAPDNLRWSGAGLRLYQRSDGLSFSYALPQRATLPAERPLTLGLLPDGLILPDGTRIASSLGDGGPQQAALTLSSFVPTRIAIQVGDGPPEARDLPGGAVVLTTPALTLPTTITLRSVAEIPVALWQIDLLAPGAPPGIAAQERVFVQIRSLYEQERFSAAIQLYTPPIAPALHQKLTALLTVAHRPRGGAWGEAGRWVFFPARSADIRLSASLRDHSATLQIDGRPVELIGAVAPPADGDYQASLLLANDAEIVAGYAIWYWSIAEGQVVRPYVDDTALELVALPFPATALNYRSPAGTLILRGFTLSARRVVPGARLEPTLVWQNTARLDQDYRARLSLLRPDGTPLLAVETTLGKFDYPPTRWQEGELGERATSLDLPPDTPPGRYTLTAELLAADGSTLPLQTPAGPQPRVELVAVEVGT